LTVIVVRCCGLSKVWNGGDGVLQGMWLVLLKLSKDRFLGLAPQDNMYHHVSDIERLAD
jgi:hypothetical protein